MQERVLGEMEEEGLFIPAHSSSGPYHRPLSRALGEGA